MKRRFQIEYCGHYSVEAETEKEAKKIFNKKFSNVGLRLDICDVECDDDDYEGEWDYEDDEEE